jgi:hypothetical protein
MRAPPFPLLLNAVGGGPIASPKERRSMWQLLQICPSVLVYSLQWKGELLFLSLLFFNSLFPFSICNFLTFIYFIFFF